MVTARLMLLMESRAEVNLATAGDVTIAPVIETAVLDPNLVMSSGMAFPMRPVVISTFKNL